MDRWDGLVWGLGLITMGVLFLLHYLNLVEWTSWRVWWPTLVIFFGAMRLFTARTPHRIGDSVTWVLMGGWFLVATNEWYGLGWRNSWPLALVAAGVGTVVRALASFVMRRDDRDDEAKADARS
jgi:hypothetical protein